MVKSKVPGLRERSPEPSILIEIGPAASCKGRGIQDWGRMGGGEAGSEAPQVCRGKEEKGEEETVLKGILGIMGILGVSPSSGT